MAEDEEGEVDEDQNQRMNPLLKILKRIVSLEQVQTVLQNRGHYNISSLGNAVDAIASL